MRKFTAFTLAETLITLTTIGVLAAIMISLMDVTSVYEKTDAAKVYKAFEEVQQAAAKIRSTETGKCPEGTFLTKIRNMSQSDILAADAYNYEYALYKDDDATTLAPTADVARLFAQYLRFEQGRYAPPQAYSPVTFCNYTSYCSNNAIVGGKMAGDVYIGFEVFGDTAVQTCPKELYMPKFNKEDYKNHQYYEYITKTDAQAGKCWGKVYVFVKRNKAQNTLGKDIFVWGLDENGLTH